MNLKRFLSCGGLLAALALGGCRDNENFAAGEPSPIISIDDVRRLHQGSDVALSPDKLTGARQIVGVVVSDTAGRNVPGGRRAVVLQNRRRGLVRGLIIPLPAAGASFSVGDSVVVDISGATLSRGSGALRIEGLSPANIQKVSGGLTPRVRDVSLAALLANAGEYEGTLVRVTGGSLRPAPTNGETYAGDRNLVAGRDSVVLHTEATALFATRRLPASATFVGIPVGSSNGLQLWLRTIADVIDPSGAVYPRFPESFEGVPQTTKGSYLMNTAAVPDNTVTFGTGPWRLYQAILGNTSGRDRYTGTQGIRLQQGLTESALVEMRFDVPNGASKVTLIYGAYHTDASSTWRLEYSQDQGRTWQQTGPTVTDAGNWQRSITFLLNLRGPVRFRVNKLGLGVSNPPAVSNGRLGLDDIAIYEN